MSTHICHTCAIRHIPKRYFMLGVELSKYRSGKCYICESENRSCLEFYITCDQKYFQSKKAKCVKKELLEEWKDIQHITDKLKQYGKEVYQRSLEESKKHDYIIVKPKWKYIKYETQPCSDPDVVQVKTLCIEGGAMDGKYVGSDVCIHNCTRFISIDKKKQIVRCKRSMWEQR